MAYNLAWQYVIAAALCMVMILVTASTSSSAAVVSNKSVAASVSVVCSFSVSLSTLPTYYILPITYDPNFTYVTNALSHGCSLPDMNGSLYITPNPGSSKIFNKTLTYPPASDTIYVSNNIFPSKASNYTVHVSFSSNNFSNSTSAVMRVVEPALLKISNLSVSPSSPIQGSRLTLSQYISNNGNLAPTNIILHTNITGSNSVISMSSSISNTGTYSITLSNATSASGNYTVSDYLTYYDGKNTNTSATFTTDYVVIKKPSSEKGAGGAAAPPVPTPPTTISSLSLTSVPVLSGITGRGTLSEYLGMKNSGTSSIWVNVSLPPSPISKLISITPKHAYVLPNESIIMQINVLNINITPGTYTLPVNISVTRLGSRSINNTLYSIITVSNKSSAPYVSVRSITFHNYDRSASGTLYVSNPTGKPIYNVTIYLSIPKAGLAISDISMEGNKTSMPGSIFRFQPPATTRRIAAEVPPAYPISTFSGTVSNGTGTYTLEWNVPELPPNSTTPIYYTVDNITNPSVLTNPTVSMMVPTAPTKIFTVSNLNIPPLNTNGSGSIDVSGLYTGETPENITLFLSTPYSVLAQVNSYTLRAYPNSQINAKFNITSNAGPGTYLMGLSIYGYGINQSYQIPMVIPSSPNTSPSPSSEENPSPPLPKPIKNNVLYILLTATVVAVMALVVYKSASRSRYSPRRAHYLSDIKRQIERDDK